jgi:hypothetical protein
MRVKGGTPSVWHAVGFEGAFAISRGYFLREGSRRSDVVSRRETMVPKDVLHRENMTLGRFRYPPRVGTRAQIAIHRKSERE